MSRGYFFPDTVNITTKSWIKNVEEQSRKLQFFKIRPQVSDRRDMGNQNFNFFSKFSLTARILISPKLCIFGRESFPTAQNEGKRQ